MGMNEDTPLDDSALDQPIETPASQPAEPYDVAKAAEAAEALGIEESDLLYLEAEADKPKEIAMDLVMRIVNAYKNAVTIAEDLETQLKEWKKRITIFEQDIVPNLLKSHGLAELKLETGEKLSYKEDVKASIPSEDIERRAAALKYLEEEGAGALIKRQFIIDIEPERREEVAQVLLEKEIAFNSVEEVNANSLAALFREWLGLKKKAIAKFERDKAPPCFNVFLYNKTSIK